MSLYESGFVESLTERRDRGGIGRGRLAVEIPNHWNGRLLRPRREWPARCRATNNLHEITPSHCRPRSQKPGCSVFNPIIKTENCQHRNGAQSPICTAEIQGGACLRWVMYGRRPRCKRNLTISEAFGCSHVSGL